MITNWGYSIERMGDIISESEFNEMTAGRFSGDQRIQPMIDAATAAVRNYCGWHLFPVGHCTYSTRARDKRLIYVGGDTIIQLPARYVTSVSSVKVGGNTVTDYSFDPDGMLRIYDAIITDRRTVIEVIYDAGLPADLASGIKEVVAGQATHGLAQSYGVQSEAAGGVSVSYSASWLNSSQASALPDTNKEILSAYRLQGVF